MTDHDAAYKQLDQLVTAGETGLIYEMLTIEQVKNLAADWYMAKMQADTPTFEELASARDAATVFDPETPR